MPNLEKKNKRLPEGEWALVLIHIKFILTSHCFYFFKVPDLIISDRRGDKS